MNTTTSMTTSIAAGPPERAAAAPAVRFLHRKRQPLALAVLASAQFLVMLDTSIVNVALPSIQTQLGFGPTAVTWVVNAYVLAFAGLLLLSGRAADLFGRRRLFTIGASLFTLGTLLAALATGPGMLIGGM